MYPKKNSTTNNYISIVKYTVITILIVQGLTLVGFNVYILNYIFETSKPALMFISYSIWGLIIMLAGEL